MSRNTNFLIFLTATPHRGDSSNFRLFLDLLEAGFFANNEMLQRIDKEERQSAFPQKTERRSEGFRGTIFPPRRVITIKYRLSDDEKRLYNAVTEYVEEFHQKAMEKEKRNAAFALLILKSVAETWDALLKFPGMPILDGDHVFRNAVIQGVLNGTFGLVLDDKVRFMEPISLAEIPEEAVILRKEIAMKMKQEIAPAVATLPSVSEAPEGVAGAKLPHKKIIRSIAIRAKVPWDRLSSLVSGVITPLRREGADISLEVKIEAQFQQGINRDTLDLKVKETLNQVGAEVLEEHEE